MVVQLKETLRNVKCGFINGLKHRKRKKNAHKFSKRNVSKRGTWCVFQSTAARFGWWLAYAHKISWKLVY